MPMTLWRCLLILALAWTTPALALDRDALLDEANVLLLPRDRVIPPLTLIDQDGQPFDTRSLQGRWHILFFGFTACPDICPTTLSDMRRLFSQLPSDTRERLQLVLITADPERDTPQQLKTYLDYYRAGFSGLTGEMEQLQQLSRALGLPFVPANETQGDYRSATAAIWRWWAPTAPCVGTFAPHSCSMDCSERYRGSSIPSTEQAADVDCEAISGNPECRPAHRPERRPHRSTAASVPPGCRPRTSER